MVKKILKVLAVIIVILLIGSLFISKEYKAEKSIVIKAPVQTVFDQVNNLKNWQAWEPWGKMDATMKKTYTGPESGVGAAYSWDGTKMGKGTLTIAESVPSSVVKTALDFDGNGTGGGGFTFEETPEGTKVNWTFDSYVGWNPIGKYMMLMMDGTMKNMMDQGLGDLKKVAEAAPVPTAAAADIKVEEKELTATPYLYVKTTANNQNISQIIGESYGKIGAVMAKQKLTQAGAPFCIYYKWDNNSFEFDAGIPSNAAGKTDGEVMAGEIKAGKAVVATYFGKYEESGKGHDAANSYIKEKGLTVIGAPWEVYANDPMSEKDTAKWQTDIYYRIQ